MNITTFIKIYLITLPVFFAIDMIWLGLIARNFYRENLGSLLKDNVNWTAAIVFYLMFIAGMIIFVISPALEKNSWTHALIYGALFGLITYATYDLTNLATLKDWSLTVVIVDMIWGMILSASVSTISYFISSKFVI
ncbi:MAG: DUF2177 family protein [Acidobacteriota bacterium]